MNSSYKPKVPDIVESIFDVCYLAFDFIAAIIFFTRGGGKTLFLLCGALALILGAGDAFHLVPRVVRAIKGSSKKIEWYLGLGLAVSSVTMTVFYIVLFYIWKEIFPADAQWLPAVFPALLWATALFRIAVCFLPQNRWFEGNENLKMSFLRNIPFGVTGVIVVILFFITGNTGGYNLWRMGIAIIISFSCYVPVTVLAKRYPPIGALMIPKTCAYIWMIMLLLGLLP